jgi:hypothetical protein
MEFPNLQKGLVATCFLAYTFHFSIRRPQYRPSSSLLGGLSSEAWWSLVNTLADLLKRLMGSKVRQLQMSTINRESR